MWCWGFMFINTCRLTDVSASTAELDHGCLTPLPGWEEKWSPFQLVFLLSFTDSLFISCYRHNSLTLGEELASSFPLSQGCPFSDWSLVRRGREIQTKLTDSSDCTSDPQQRPRSYYFLRYGEEMANSSVIGKKKRGRSDTTEASPKGKQYRRFFLFHIFKFL